MTYWDTESKGGWGPFSISQEHPFAKAGLFRLHDVWYDQLKAGTATKTLKQIDREFLANMLRVAAKVFWFTKDPADLALYTRHAWRFYRIARFWAKNVRQELEAFRPR